MGREEQCKQISLACVGSAHSVSATLGFPCPRPVCFPRLHCSGFRLLYRDQALSCMHFPGLSHSSSGSRVLRKGADSVGPGFCAIPHLSSSGILVLDEHTLFKRSMTSPLPAPASVSRCAQSGVPCVSSGELICGCDPPGRCQPSRISGSLW